MKPLSQGHMGDKATIRKRICLLIPRQEPNSLDQPVSLGTILTSNFPAASTVCPPQHTALKKGVISHCYSYGSLCWRPKGLIRNDLMK